jgi:hypothetical protein
MSSYNTKLLENGANDSYNYILNNLVNGLAKKSDNKNSKNVINKGKAKNNSDRNDNSNNTDDNNFKDSDSSNSNKSDKAYRCTEWQKLPTLITG